MIGTYSVGNKEMDKVENFLENLTREDIDLQNKLDNMCGCEISDDLYSYISKDDFLCKKIEDEVVKVASYYAAEIKKETEELKDLEIISDTDYSSGLYNCDAIYISAIIRAIGIDASSLRLCL